MALSNAALKRLRYLTFRADAPAPSEIASSYGAELLLLGPERSIAGSPLRPFSIADRCTIHNGLLPQLSESAMAFMPLSSLH